jgi:hypothetical protein
MRKVLLATTALVALGGVSVANAADLSISGSHQTAYFSEDHSTNGTSDGMQADGNIKFKATSTTDSGLTVTGYTSVGSHTGSEEDSYVQVVGDFGTIMLGGADAITDGMDGDITAASVQWGIDEDTITNPVLMSANGARLLTHTLHDGDVKANYKSPSISLGAASAQIGITANPGKDGIATQIVVKAGPVSIGYGQDEFSYTAADTPSGGTSHGIGDYTSSMIGVGVTMGDVSIRFADGDREYKTAAGVSTNKVQASEFGVTYSGIAGTDLYYTHSEEKEVKATAQTLTVTHIGLTYSVAPGVSVFAENGSAELKSTGADSTYNAVGIAFSW